MCIEVSQIVQHHIVMQPVKPRLAACRMWEDHPAKHSVRQRELIVTLLAGVREHHARRAAP